MMCGLIDCLESEFFLKEKLNKHAGSAAECPTAHLPVSLETKGFKTAHSAHLLAPQCKGSPFLKTYNRTVVRDFCTNDVTINLKFGNFFQKL
jgi:hypothetical protein